MSGCPCDPSGSDGLQCPDTNGNLLCDDVLPKMVTAFLDAQPFAITENRSTRTWELFSNTDPLFLRAVVRASLKDALAAMEKK
jgi:hypothetical protein